MAMVPVEVELPRDCASIDVQNPHVIAGHLFLDRHCFSLDGNDRHEILEVDVHNRATSVASIPWFPDSYVQLSAGAWIAGFDSGPCGWIDVVPHTGDPGGAWPINVTDDGESFAVNASPKGHCDGAVLASSVDRSSTGMLAFIASGAARSQSGSARLDVAENLYTVPEAGGEPRRIASGLVEPRNVEWSTDGASVIVIVRAGTGSALLEVNAAGSKTVLYEGQPMTAAWAPDGRRIAIVVGNETENRLLLLPVVK
jgi:hypothetical protein